MSRIALPNVTVAAPARGDKVLISDVSDSGAGRLATISSVQALADEFAEIRALSSAGIGPTSYSSTEVEAVFSRNVPLSSAVAGDADAGTVLTADQANNKLVIPPQTRVFVEFSISLALQYTSASDHTTWEAQAALDGTLQPDTAGIVGTAVNANATNSGVTVHGSGYVDNATGSAADLTLEIKSISGTLAGFQGGGFLRARYVKSLA